MSQLKVVKNSLDIACYGITRDEAKRLNICISCRKPPVFNTVLGQKEYQISALCETCFDEITKEEE